MKLTSHRLFKMAVLASFSVFLCSFTLVLGAVPLHAWRQCYGRRSFVTGSGLLIVISSSFGFFPLAIVLAILSLLIFLFNDFEEKGHGILASGGFALLGTSFAGFIGTMVLLPEGVEWKEALRTPVEATLKQLATMNQSQNLQITAEEILVQVPSFAISVLILSLALAILFEVRTRAMLGLPARDRVKEFLKFRLPDVFIWLTIFSLLAAFVKSDFNELQIIAKNLVNIFGVVYFIQGMAIVTQFFISYKVGPMMRMFSYIFWFCN